MIVLNKLFDDSGTRYIYIYIYIYLCVSQLT